MESPRLEDSLPSQPHNFDRWDERSSPQQGGRMKNRSGQTEQGRNSANPGEKTKQGQIIIRLSTICSIQ